MKEGGGRRLVLFDRHTSERLEDPGHQHFHVAVVALVVLGDDLPQPLVVPVVGGPPRLPLAKRGVLLGHRRQAMENEDQLHRHRLLAPERAIVVEYSDALGWRDAHRRDEAQDRIARRGVIPGRQWLVRHSQILTSTRLTSAGTLRTAFRPPCGSRWPVSRSRRGTRRFPGFGAEGIGEAANMRGGQWGGAIIPKVRCSNAA